MMSMTSYLYLPYDNPMLATTPFFSFPLEKIFLDKLLDRVEGRKGEIKRKTSM